LEVELTSAVCQQQQDTSVPDAIFWVTYFTQVEDLPGFYFQIDEAIKSGTIGSVPLDFESKTLIKHTGLFDFMGGQSHSINHIAGDVDLIQGFGPWHCQMVCYEDDNQEYEAMIGVLDQISEYAGYIQQGAEIVAMMSGPTVIAAGAAAVASVAESVKTCAYVGSAIISIVNFFDENDNLGSKVYNGLGDYAGETIGDILLDPADLGLYTMVVSEKRLGPAEEVTRIWQIRRINLLGPVKNVDSGLLPGIDDYFHTMNMFDEPVHQLSNYGVDPEWEGDGWNGDTGHCEWDIGPVLEGTTDNLRLTGGWIRVGRDGYGSVKLTPWVEGLIFLKHT
jgi:hypothetical protein